MLGDVSGRQVLDAGCGQGYLCRLLADRGAKVTGVEPVNAMISYARVKEETSPRGITYLQEDVAELSTPAGTFDACVANMVLLDIPDWRTAMARCVAALRTQGAFIWST